ncbi:MAG: tetratricopeptide repeat protein, partial [Bacteroidales bacterium]|nr:tetratricopeptide repeat protein [Bacteroidales bacterium]
MAKILNNLFAVNVLIGLAFLLSCQSDQFKYEDNVLSKRQADSGLVFKDPGLENIIIKYNEVKLLFDSLSIYESLEDQKQIIRVKILLAEACRQSGNYIYGLNFLKDIPDDEEHIGSKQMAGVYNGLAAIYYELYIHNRDLSHYLDSALMFANRSLEIAEKSNDHSLKSDAMNIIGATYIHNKKYEKARAILQNAYAVNQSQDAKMNLGILANLAYVNHKLNNYEKAMEYARLCLKNAVDSENLIFTITAIKTMLDVYKVTGDSEMALKMENKLKILESQKDIVLESLALKQLILEEENQTAQRKILGLYHERYYLFRLSVILIVGILVAVIVAVLLIMY